MHLNVFLHLQPENEIREKVFSSFNQVEWNNDWRDLEINLLWETINFAIVLRFQPEFKQQQQDLW